MGDPPATTRPNEDDDRLRAAGFALLNDAPLSDPGEDVLGRAPFARQLARAIREMEAGSGFVFALNGPWGSGKTTTLNFVLRSVEEENQSANHVVVVRFNPWWFSGREQILLQFFRQLTSSLNVKGIPQALRQVGNGVGKLAGLMEPVASALATAGVPGPLVPAAKGLAALFKRDARTTDLQKLRADIDHMLLKQPHRILIVIDDIDRLSGDEIREVFQLVKAVADFPKTIYLLAFDRPAVVRALDPVRDGTGEQYLEKIVQAAYDLPLPDRTELQGMLFRHLDKFILPTPEDLWDQDEWRNVFAGGIDRFIRTPRDIKRLMNALRPEYPLVVQEVSCVDFIALQTIRVFVPDLFSFISASKEMLTGAEETGKAGDASREAAKKTFEAVLAALPGDYRSPSNHIMSVLFPRWAFASGGGGHGPGWLDRWYRERRVCSPDIFDIFFRLFVISDDLSRQEMKAIIETLDQPEAFAPELKRLSGAVRRDKTTKLRAFLDRFQFFTESEIPREAVEPILRVFFDVGDEFYLETDQHGMLDVGNDMRIMRITHQLLSHHFDQNERFELLRRVLSEAKAIALLAEKVAILGQEHGKYGAGNPDPEDMRTVNAEQLGVLETIALGRIRWSVESGTLRYAPELASVLFRLADWSSLEEAKGYVVGLIESDEGLVDYLAGLESWVYTSQQGDEGKRTWVVRPEHVGHFVDFDPADLLPRCDKILRESRPFLTARKRRAMEAFVRGMKDVRWDPEP